MKQDYDFGFSFISEDEMRAQEKALKEQLVAKDMTSKEKMEGLVAMFMPLLNRLLEKPEAKYIEWPGDKRVANINEFKKRVKVYIEDNQ